MIRRIFGPFFRAVQWAPVSHRPTDRTLHSLDTVHRVCFRF